MELIPKNFDSELTLAELLTSLPAGKLQAGLEAMYGSQCRLVAVGGQLVAGNAEIGDAPIRTAIRLELEPIGYLETATDDRQKIKAAVAFIELILHSSARYHMASILHLEAIHADYETLQKKHMALAMSEARYRELALSLEVRVQEQVGVIETAHRQLYQAEKMASVGQLAAGIAHEINNPMGFIKSNLSTARTYVQQFKKIGAVIQSGPDSAIVESWRQADLDFVMDDFADLLEESIAGAERITRIVADLKDFSTIDHADIQLVNLNDNIRSVCNMATMEISKTADLSLTLGELPQQKCHAGRINQAILNILLNAAQAVQQGGKIAVHSAYGDGFTSICLSDNGCGISATVLPRIFDPFFTTRAVGKGTGLGLTVARDIVAAHGGDISIQSAPAQGTTVTIRLPVR